MSAAPLSNTPAIWALGVTQIIGYGTLYYSFSILAVGISADLGVALEWIYGCMSLALLVGGLISPYSGSLADRFGAAKVMSLGSIAAGGALVICGLADNVFVFLLGLVLAELAAAFVLYTTAFTLLAQTTGQHAQRSITLLTLIAGFASTIFWPMTSWMSQGLDWRQIYLVFAAMNLAVCLPLHVWLTRFARLAAARPDEVETAPALMAGKEGRNIIFMLVVLGFSLVGFVSAATLFHMVPLLSVLGLGVNGVFVASLLGPAQVGARLLNMMLGRALPATALSVLAAFTMPAALVVLATSAPSVAGAAIFAIVFGMGTGLFSIVAGTLPLALFGKLGFGKRMGWIGLGRLCLSALAPVAFSIALGAIGPKPSLWILAIAGMACVAVFAEIWRRARSRASSLAVAS